MVIQDLSKEQLIEELVLLRQEVAALRGNQVAVQDQKKLIENLLAMFRYVSGKVPLPEDRFLEESLQQSLDKAVDLTHAETGSLFLLDDHDVITHSILTRSDCTPKNSNHLIGSVLDKGLAGWVARNRCIGLISDTKQDERWLTLPNQPDTVSSALAIPILRGDDLLAVITLMHSEKEFFNLETAKLVEITVNYIALVLEVAARKIQNAAFEIQTKLLEKLVDIARSPAGVGVLHSALQTTLDIAAEQTYSEKGSLFVLDPAGKVVDAILSRSEVTPEQRNRLIGNVLGEGLAGWVVHHRQIGLITDTNQDERWLTLPDQPYIARSALAVPIVRGDELLGIITLLHSQPEHFTPEVGKLMQVTADQMSLVLENARLYSKLDDYSKALNDEMEKGRQIQIDFLPYELLEYPNWEIAACFHPAKQVAGDFYDTFLLGDYVGLVIADVCDKGVGAALFMALMRSLIRVFSGQTNLSGLSILGDSLESESIACSFQTHALQAVELTNNYVAENHWHLSMFATMFFGILDPATGLLTYINGGHEPLFVLGQSGIKATLKHTGPAVGMMPNMKFKIDQVQLDPGDILLGYTDGVTEGKNPNGELFTNKRLLSLLEQPANSASDLLDRIETDLFAHIDDATQFDDITMLVVMCASLPGL